MAVTRTFSEALSIAGIGRKIEDDQAPYILSAAVTELWNSYDWRETLASLPPFFLIPGEQDYGPPFSIIPADFRGLRKAYLVQAVSNPPNRRELAIVRDVRQTEVLNLPTEIGYEPSTSSFRIFPRAANNIGGAQFLIEGTYKKRAPIFNPTNLTGTIIFDDEYFPTIVSGIKWASYQLSDDQRAGRKFQEFRSLIDEMAEREGLDLGDPVIAPAEPLVLPRDYYSPYLTI